ncbi:hypothetical protein EDB81DRAFT_488501 [Dactylonectria macrodidyma]|uniref:Uncharacterized protein n=1 Tax=Dactylonectria macrodidyma TaxID=307937 RepID=A0A9P9EW06_9HYPO|nr:hypothetical protein EDB81DRAFT_488501 [Dactylonectria macrodidyma]
MANYSEHEAMMPKFAGSQVRPVPVDGFQPVNQPANPPNLTFSAESGKKQRVLVIWSFEGVLTLFSLSLLIATIIILFKFDGLEQPDWAYGINLSTLLAILSTMLRGSLVLIAAEVISHQKWVWFDNTRPLKDFQTFDDASRGVWGSFQLIFLTWKPHIGLFAALIIILSFTIGPFTQQTLNNYVCQVPWEEANATISAAHYSTDQVEIVGHGLPVPLLNGKMKVAAINGLMGTETANGAPFNCSTGNCTFPEYQGITHSSVGFCRSCEDLTHTVKEKYSNETGWQFYMPHGPTITYGVTTDWMLSLANLRYSTLNQDAWTTAFTLLTFTFASCKRKDLLTYSCDHDYPNMPNISAFAGVLAMNCTLYPCLRNYRGRVSNGVLEEKTVSTSRINTTEGWLAFKSPCMVDGQPYDSSNFSSVPRIPKRNFTSVYQDGKNVTAPIECIYEMSGEVGFGISEFFSDMLNDTCIYDSAVSQIGPDVIVCDGSRPWLTGLYNEGQATFASVKNNLEGAVLGITNRLRTTGDNAYRNETGAVSGTTIRTTLCTTVVWGWIAVPTVLTAATILLLATSMIQSWQFAATRPIWKSSSLPLLFHKMYSGTSNALYLDQMQGAAKDIKIRLRPQDMPDTKSQL